MSFHSMLRVKYLSGCLKENQAGGWAGGGEKLHKHRQEVAQPWLPLGQWPWTCRAPSWLPGSPWQPQARLPGGPQCPSVLVCCRGNRGTQGQGCCWHTACPQRARTQGPPALGQKLLPAGALRQHQELGEWAKLGTQCMEWLPTGPMLQPQPGKCCPKTRGKAGREPGRRGAK